jgi:hypothetical protein
MWPRTFLPPTSASISYQWSRRSKTFSRLPRLMIVAFVPKGSATTGAALRSGLERRFTWSLATKACSPASQVVSL